MINCINVTSQSDIIDVVRLADEIWNGHYLTIIGQQQIDYMLGAIQSRDAISKQIATENYRYFIVNYKHQQVGYFAIVPSIQAASILISKLYVKQQNQGCGIGAEIIKYIEASAKQQNIQSLWLTVNRDNKDSIRFYSNRGFKITDSIVQSIGGGFVMDDYKMVKQLSY